MGNYELYSESCRILSMEHVMPRLDRQVARNSAALLCAPKSRAVCP
jgi:hypothetical protein